MTRTQPRLLGAFALLLCFMPGCATYLVWDQAQTLYERRAPPLQKAWVRAGVLEFTTGGVETVAGRYSVSLRGHALRGTWRRASPVFIGEEPQTAEVCVREDETLGAETAPEDAGGAQALSAFPGERGPEFDPWVEPDEWVDPVPATLYWRRGAGGDLKLCVRRPGFDPVFVLLERDPPSRLPGFLALVGSTLATPITVSFDLATFPIQAVVLWYVFWANFPPI